MLTAATFLAALEDCLGRRLGQAERLAVAVSGGADSLALLLLAADSLPGRVAALTVDHGLRPEGRGEAEAVAAICRDLDVPHHILTLRDLAGANLQARARDARYAVMAQYCLAERIGVLATAHHADDQAETVLMRLARGAGMTGTSGIRACRPLASPLLLVRPLLGARKQQLADHVRAASLVPIDDPSNRDDRFDRTRARRILSENDWLNVDGIAATARHIAAESDALDWAAGLAWDGRAEQRAGVWEVDVDGLPAALRHRLVLRALDESGCAAPRGPAIERLIVALSNGKTATLGGVRVRPGRRWRFSPAPPHRTVTSD